VAQTLSYGFINPENGDSGAIWFPALNDNIEQLNDHTHNGVNSAQLSASDIQKGSVTISSGSWTLTEAGKYQQDVTCPTGFNMDDFAIVFRIQNSFIIYPSFTRLTATTFRVFVSDNTITMTAVFR
jgi:hypothetical protein